MIPEAEALERAALEDLHRAATSAQAEALGLTGQFIGTAFASVARQLPASAIVINRCIGLGLGKAAEKTDVDALLSTYRAAALGRYFIQLHPDAQPRLLEHWLQQAGLEKARGWQKFSRGRAPAPQASTDLTVKEIGQDYANDFARILCAGFDLGEIAEPWLAQLPGREHWHVFMSFAGDQPAGVGTLFVHNGLAWLDFAATAPDFRRRGSQSALLAARLQFALDIGCRGMFTCTGVDVPGDPQHSYKNILKAGFREDYVRDNFAPPRG